MYRLSSLIGGALISQAIAFSAFAQEPGVGTPKPQPYRKVTVEERTVGKAHRREEGRAAAKDASSIGGEITPQPAAQAKVLKAEREQARAGRKAGTKRAARAGELAPTGEVGAFK